MTERYTHLSDQYLRDARNQVNLGATPMAATVPPAAKA
jgi:hypothetical protein